MGNLRVRARRGDLELVSEGEDSQAEASSRVEAQAMPGAMPLQTGSPGVELDLRGQTVDEALEVLDRYLDSAYLAGLPFVRLIHGKGTGRLREAVRRELGRFPQVTSIEPGLPNEGGDGVTVARLR